MTHMAAAPDACFARWLRSADGRRLRAVFWPCPGARATVLILSGRTEFAEKYDELARALNAEGFSAATVDWRGQGLSDRLLADPRKGHITDFHDYQLDLAALVAALNTPEFPKPLLMVAHSMGGAIGLRALCDGLAVRAAVFLAPMWAIAVPGHVSNLMLQTMTSAARTPLSSSYAPHPAPGPFALAETGAFAGNPLTGDPLRWQQMQRYLQARPELVIAGPTIGWLAAAVAECRALRRLPSPALPALILTGSAERIVSLPAIRARALGWEMAGYHEWPGAGHELLMERPPIRQAITIAILGFLRHHADA